jgi:hypothetical protein
MFSVDDERWTSGVALSGASIWCLLAGLAGAQRAPLGAIELLFLFAPLVMGPLALALAGSVSTPRLPAVETAARAMQPLAAISAVAAFWWGPGRLAGLLSIPWAMVCGAIALSGLRGLRARISLPALFGNIARIDLGLAGAWLLMSRFGVHSQFQEPIVLLTAVHFHYSGFATSVIAVSGWRFAESSGRDTRWWRWIVPAVAALPFAIAAGFVFSPALRAAAAVAFSVAIAALAILLLRQSAKFHSLTARLFVGVAASFVLVGMTLASVYAIGEASHRAWLTIPRMATTHGWFNALGFVAPALLGCLIELHSIPRGERTEVRGMLWRSEPVQRQISFYRPTFVARDFYDV